MSPKAMLIASAPSAASTHRHPIRVKSVSNIFWLIGLSSATRHVTARSLAESMGFLSPEPSDDRGIPSSKWLVRGRDHTSDESEDAWSTLDIDAVRNRLGIEFLRASPSK
jgi:hypothetical protein